MAITCPAFLGIPILYQYFQLKTAVFKRSDFENYIEPTLLKSKAYFCKKKRNSVIYPESFEIKVGFTKIRALVRDLCLSPMGKNLTDEMRFSNGIKAIVRWQQEVNEFKYILENTDTFPSDDYFDLRGPLAKIRVEGTFLEEKELHQLRRLLKTVRNIVRFFSKEENVDKYPNLKALSDNVKIYPYISEGIDRILNSQGKVKDNASPELAKIRSEKAVKQASVSKMIHRLLAHAQKEGWVDEESNLAIRNGRAVIPVPVSNKRKISGIIHDESATGKTCYVEPAPVVEVNNQLAELEAAERREVIKILKEFTETIRPYADDLEDSVMFLGIIDFIRAKAQFGRRIGAVMPIIEQGSAFEWKNARHPLLMLSFEEEGKEVVPLNISLNSQNRLLLISGPNAGGKSVCLKTVGLVQYMFQSGLPVPMEVGSKVGVFRHLFIDIGDEQSIEDDLSTYSSHLMNMKHFVRNSDKNTLLLIDEFGTGTEPSIGGAIAEAVLHKLNTNQAYGVITTHYSNLKHFASQQEGLVNGAMLYDTGKLEPMFKLEIGKPGSSFAFEIAHKIGLPNEVINEAKERLGEGHVDFDKHLKEIVRDQRYWERKRQNIRKVERRLEELLDKEQKELSEVKEQRTKILKEAKDKAEKILADSNKVVENTIRQIKEAQAEKEKTRDIRKNLEEFKEDIQKDNPELEAKIQRKMNKLREKESKVKAPKVQKPQKKTISNEVEEKPLCVGEIVKINGQTVAGEIISISKKKAMVSFGQIRTEVELSRLVRSNKEAIKQQTKHKGESAAFKQSMELDKRRMKFKPGLDIRGKRVEDAMSIVVDFIDEAIVVGANEVKILHGKGNGVLRQVIRDYLYTVTGVVKVADEHIDFGGAGITVVTLG
jgi:DNA mismatch repair protein MutS2